MADIQLANSGINSGTAVTLQGATMSFGLKRFVNIKPIIAQTSDYKIAKQDTTGVDNPVITIRGAVDVDAYTTTTALWATTSITNITLGFLYEVWRNQAGNLTLTIPLGNPADQRNWKTYDGSATSIPVVLESISLKPRDDSDGNHFIDYTLNLREIVT